jgi:hypothetical protein
VAAAVDEQVEVQLPLHDVSSKVVLVVRHGAGRGRPRWRSTGTVIVR